MKKYILLIGLILAVLSISAVSAGLCGDDANEVVLKIESEDSSMSGIVEIYEYKNIDENNDGTVNASNFYDTSGYLKGSKHAIKIKDGQAEYKLHNDTQYFGVYYFITDINNDYEDDATAPIVTVEYFLNGDSLLSSAEKAYYDQCDISFGDQIYSINGDLAKLNIDDSKLKDVISV